MPADSVLARLFLRNPAPKAVIGGIERGGVFVSRPAGRRRCMPPRWCADGSRYFVLQKGAWGSFTPGSAHATRCRYTRSWSISRRLRPAGAPQNFVGQRPDQRLGGLKLPRRAGLDALVAELVDDIGVRYFRPSASAWGSRSDCVGTCAFAKCRRTINGPSKDMFHLKTMSCCGVFSGS